MLCQGLTEIDSLQQSIGNVVEFIYFGLFLCTEFRHSFHPMFLDLTFCISTQNIWWYGVLMLYTINMYLLHTKLLEKVYYCRWYAELGPREFISTHHYEHVIILPTRHVAPQRLFAPFESRLSIFPNDEQFCHAYFL